MYCTNCGNPMNPNSNFCTKCGNGINNQNNNQVLSNDSKKVSIGSCIGISILTAIIIFMVPFIFNLIYNLITGNIINENLNYVLTLIQLNLPIWIIIFGPFVIYLIKKHKLK